MMEHIASWFTEKCPYCQQKLVTDTEGHTLIRHCPDEHYAIECNTVLGVEVEHHASDMSPRLH